jgi:hypothetical protein
MGNNANFDEQSQRRSFFDEATFETYIAKHWAQLFSFCVFNGTMCIATNHDSVYSRILTHVVTVYIYRAIVDCFFIPSQT